MFSGHGGSELGTNPKPSGANLQLLLEHDMTRSSIVPGTQQREYVSIDTYAPSTKAIAELTPINISQLQPDKHHYGKILFARTIESGIRVSAVQTVIEDDGGNAVRLVVRNGDTSVPADEILPENAILAIKEPFYSVTSTGAYGIRIDHPSDLVHLSIGNPQLPQSLRPQPDLLNKSAQEWKSEGNDAYGSQRFVTALHAYTQALDVCTNTEEKLRRDILRNRAAVNIFLNRFEQALHDAKSAVIPPGGEGFEDSASVNGKAYERAGHAAYQLGRFADAAEQYRHVQDLISEHSGASVALQRIECRLQEERNGEYDFAKMRKSCNRKHSRLDHASFVANTKVRATKTRGNGLFAKKRFIAGDLIMVEKALAISFDTDPGSETYTIFNNKTERVVAGTQATLLFKLVQLLLHSERDAAKFYDLFDAEYQPKLGPQLSDGVVPVDSFRAEAIIEYNSFACPSMKPRTSKAGAKEVDVEALYSTGFWCMASYINHACDGNAMRAFIGDMMIIRATKDIAEGEEILMPYRLPDKVNAVTQEKLQKTWGFKCDCAICLAEATVAQSQLKKRQQMIERLDRVLSTKSLSVHHEKNKKDIALIESLTERLRETYEDSAFEKKPRLALVGPTEWICRAHSQGGLPDKIVEASLAVFRELGFVIAIKGTAVNIDRRYCISERTSIDAARDAARALRSKGSAGISSQFVALAKTMHLICNADASGYQDEL